MSNVLKEKKQKKDEPNVCEYCSCNWYCQCSDREKLSKPCYQELVKKYVSKDGIKIAMFY